MTALLCDTMNSPIGEPCAPVTITLESCQGSWMFQPARMRFRRALRVPGRPGATTEWCTYFGLHFVDADRFVVLLNPQGTRLLHSWRHRPGTGCDACTGPRSTEHMRGEMRQLAG